MEKVETKDFMNVDSFSQLPFIRPSPAKDKSAVRLFGIEFQNSAAEEATAASDHKHNSNSNNNNNNNSGASEGDVLTSTNTATSTESSGGRKFECHYCCRNFPTSQALGGHQNAHKRERQHAKRAYLQSAAMLHHHPSAPTTDHHLYGYHHRHLPSWASTSSTTNNYHNTLTRYFPSSYHSYPSSHLHHRQPPAPINGSPLSTWRIPALQSANRDRSLLQNQYPPPPPLSHHHHPPLALLSKVSESSSQPYALEAKNNKSFQDHVSLDLHL